jgi:hypothetical protein
MRDKNFIFVLSTLLILLSLSVFAAMKLDTQEQVVQEKYLYGMLLKETLHSRPLSEAQRLYDSIVSIEQGEDGIGHIVKLNNGQEYIIPENIYEGE